MPKGTLPTTATHDKGSDMTHQFAESFTDQLMNELLNYQASPGNQ
jgi:hypothetical protein